MFREKNVSIQICIIVEPMSSGCWTICQNHSGNLDNWQYNFLVIGCIWYVQPITKVSFSQKLTYSLCNGNKIFYLSLNRQHRPSQPCGHPGVTTLITQIQELNVIIKLSYRQFMANIFIYYILDTLKVTKLSSFESKIILSYIHFTAVLIILNYLAQGICFYIHCYCFNSWQI